MTLIAGAGTQRVSRDVLATLPVPERTDTFQPISHELLVQEVENSLAFRHINVVAQEFAVSADGMKMFGLLEVNAEYEGVRFAIGLRSANDKSMRLGIVAGYRVMVCSNMSFNGDFNPMLAKHSKHLNLTESVSIAIDRIQRNWDPLRKEIDRKRITVIPKDDVRLLVYNAFAVHKFPVSLFKSITNVVEKEERTTLWNLENHFTESFKKLNPISQYQTTARLPKALQYRNHLPIAGDDFPA